MRKKISEMTAVDKADFLEVTKQTIVRQYGIPWEFYESRMTEEIDKTFNDSEFIKMDPDSRIDAAYARKEFGDKKPEIVDYMLWMVKFVTKSDIIEW